MTTTESQRGRGAVLPYGVPYLIGDPASGRRDLTELRRALAGAGVVAEAAVARPASRAGAVAGRALERGARFLVAVGSDRVAHAIVERLVGPEGPRVPDAVLGLVGLGRQDLAATFGLPEDPTRAVRHLLGPNLFLADVGRARWGGPDGAERVMELRLAGLVIANGQFSMGRMKVAPRALPDDGRMSVIAFQGQPLAIYSRSRELYYGDHIPHPTVREYQSERVEVATAEPLALALDGCRMAGGPPLAVDVLRKVLRVKV